MTENNFQDELKQVLVLLQSGETSLVRLAAMSGRDPFTFYQRAHLTNLDLSGQDLRGLNFEGANLLGSKLEEVNYESGAFNGSILDPQYRSYEDDYIFRIEDILHPFVKRIFCYVEFRLGAIDAIIESAGFSYGDASARAKISSATLRKARRGEMIVIDSARAIGNFVQGLSTSEEGYLHPSFSALRQPLAKILKLDEYGAHPLEREEFWSLLPKVEELVELRKRRYPDNSYIHNWRDSPQMIDFQLRYYRIMGGIFPPDDEPQPDYSR
ncbi:MAG TPA: pentapeptide repeat-containing protein [Allosphingosinicella sp.]|jgi:hypothetical protein